MRNTIFVTIEIFSVTVNVLALGLCVRITYEDSLTGNTVQSGFTYAAFRHALKYSGEIFGEFTLSEWAR